MGTSKLGFWILLLCNLLALPAAVCDTTPSGSATNPLEELWATSAFNITGPLRAPLACDNTAVLPWADAIWQPSCSLNMNSFGPNESLACAAARVLPCFNCIASGRQDVDQWAQHLEPSSKAKVLVFCFVLFSADVDRHVKKNENDLQNADCGFCDKNTDDSH